MIKMKIALFPMFFKKVKIVDSIFYQHLVIAQNNHRVTNSISDKTF